MLLDNESGEGFGHAIADERSTSILRSLALVRLHIIDSNCFSLALFMPRSVASFRHGRTLVPFL